MAPKQPNQDWSVEMTLFCVGIYWCFPAAAAFMLQDPFVRLGDAISRITA